MLGDALSFMALDAVERAAAIRKRNIGEAISSQEVEELLDWISEAIPEQQ